MLFKWARAVAIMSFVAVLGGLLATSAGASRRAGKPVQGVTNDEVQMVASVPGIDSLIAKGFNLPKLSTTAFLKRAQYMADANGPINGRKIVIKPATWDPIDPTSYGRACTIATQDNKPFLVLNSVGYEQGQIPCV